MNEEKSQKGKAMLRLVVLLFIACIIYGAIKHSPEWKNHNNGLCDYCEASGHTGATYGYYQGEEVCITHHKELVGYK